MAISKECIDAVKSGILTDEQLQEAINHFTTLEKHLRPHEEYVLVLRDVRSTLLRLADYQIERREYMKIQNKK